MGVLFICTCGMKTRLFVLHMQAAQVHTSLDAHGWQVFTSSLSSTMVHIRHIGLNCHNICATGNCRRRMVPQRCTMQRPMGMPRQWRHWWMPPPVTAMCRTPTETLLCTWRPPKVLPCSVFYKPAPSWKPTCAWFCCVCEFIAAVHMFVCWQLGAPIIASQPCFLFNLAASDISPANGL